MLSEAADTHIRLELSGVPAVYTPEDLRERADQLVEEIEDLLRIEDRLLHSRLRYRLSHDVDRESGRIKHLVLLDLVPKASVQRDLFMGALDQDGLEAAVTADSQTLLDAFRQAPQMCDRARVQFAMRNAIAVRNCEPRSVPGMDRGTGAYLKNRRRSFSGHVAGFPWQLHLEHVGFEWDCTPSRMRVRVYRERDGFSLRPLNMQLMAKRGRQRLRMDFPADLEALAALDRASHTGKPQTILVRLARDPGDAECSRADFLGFEANGTESN